MPILGLTAKRIAILGMLLMAITLSCGSASSAAPPDPQTTPGVAPSPTAAPEPTVAPTAVPTPESLNPEQLTEQLRIEAQAIAERTRRFRRGDNRNLEEDARHYVPLYLASLCVSGKEPSVEDFKVYAANAIGRRIFIHREALREVRVIVGVADDWRRQTLNPVTQRCLQPYLYPESLTDAAPAVDLYLASQLPSLPPLARGGVEAEVRRRAGGWFDQEDRQEPYLAWLCGNDC